MDEVQDLEFETPLEEEVEPIEVSPNKRYVYTESSDPEIESLHNKSKRGRLVVQPDFQRQFVWDNKRSSRLLESALLGIPIPIIYLSEEPDTKEYVIDGQQRLTSFFSFLTARFPTAQNSNSPASRYSTNSTAGNTASFRTRCRTLYAISNFAPLRSNGSPTQI
jgi:Protein of unknown function DUF262